MGIYEELVERQLIAQVTDEEEIKNLINKGGATFYIGFDPTADSLHIGHYMTLCLMKRLQLAGNKPIILLGGGTAHIGDPSGRNDLRRMMSDQEIDHNVQCFKEQIAKLVEIEGGHALVLDNNEWLAPLKYIDVLSKVGRHFSVNNMLRAECYKQRMENGLSFLEFNYMIMQAYDFYYLSEHYGCNMQFGGDDQWSNMLAGRELIRKVANKPAYALTINLLLNSEGKKMGKTSAGAVWLDPNKTTPFNFYQYWRNVDDVDAIRFVKMLTFIPLEEIREMEKWDASRINEVKEILAFEMTKNVHGKEEAEQARNAAKALFSNNGGDDSSIPTTELKSSDIKDGGLSLLDILVSSGLASSKGDARRVSEQGGVSVDGERVIDPNYFVSLDKLSAGIKVKKGKKTFKKIIAK